MKRGFYQNNTGASVKDDGPSFASLLIRQSPAPHYGNGWIMGEDGKPWHPCRDQSALLNELQSKPKASLSTRLLKFFWRRYEQQLNFRAK
ncbi:phage filamentation protein Fil family protein [Phytobacter sp. V91]|uniref:phage filamentation protein Fil family protein n=1 Tax=Phytobacter sp. V91 TaxID=3369425 RepID=UPI003F631379